MVGALCADWLVQLGPADVPCRRARVVQRMGFLDSFRAKTPQEVMRENKRMLDRSIRELDRERAVIEGQVRKTMGEMKKMAKAGQEVHVRRPHED